MDAFETQKNILKVLKGDIRDLSVGDDVVIGIPEQALIRLAFLVYGLPILVVLFIAGIAQSLGWPDWAVLVSAIAGFIAGFMIVKWVAGRWSCDFRYHPTLIAKCIASVKLG